MKLTRRQFGMLAAAVAAGCGRNNGAAATTTKATTGPATDPSQPGAAVDAGPIGDFKADDVYDTFRDQGFFVIRREDKLFALSSVCTHKGCKVRVQNDLTFLCKCHGSRFDKGGKVTKGPAQRDLPRLPVAEGADQHLFIDPIQPTKS